MSGGGSNEVKETAEQKALAEVAVKEWNRNQEIFVPMQNDYIKYANSMGNDVFYNQAADDTSLAFNKNYGEAQQQTEKNLAAAGVDPTSGKATGARSDLIEDQLTNQNQATSQAQHDQTGAYTGSLANVTAMGRGQQTQAINSLQDIATASGNKAQADAINKANQVSPVGVAAGVGATVAASNPDWFSGSKALSDYNNVSSGAQTARNTHNQTGAMGV